MDVWMRGTVNGVYSELRDGEPWVLVPQGSRVDQSPQCCDEHRGCRWPMTCNECGECIAARPQP